MTFEPLRALRVLNDRGVEYVLVGGFAGELLGAPLATNDIDICYERSRPNLERLADALRVLGARLRVAGVDEDPPFVLDADSLANGDSFTFSTDCGDLDVLGTPSGTRGYADLVVGSSSMAIEPGLTVRVVELAALIRMKEAAGRPKDRAHLVTLLALKEEIAEQEASGGSGRLS